MADLITNTLIEKALNYQQYRQLLDQLVEAGQTTGPIQNESLAAYTKQNVQRMRRLDKTVELMPELEQVLAKLETPWIWLVLTEGWCGDAAQNIPVIEQMAEVAQPHIQVRYLLRDEHPTLMDAYLTNGTRSIPKLICLTANALTELGTWGPRPKIAHEMVRQFKQKGELTHEEYVVEIIKWYNEDKTTTLQHEFLALIQGWELIGAMLKVEM